VRLAFSVKSKSVIPLHGNSLPQNKLHCFYITILSAQQQALSALLKGSLSLRQHQRLLNKIYGPALLENFYRPIQFVNLAEPPIKIALTRISLTELRRE
jgi:hypothetical protein